MHCKLGVGKRARAISYPLLFLDVSQSIKSAPSTFCTALHCSCSPAAAATTAAALSDRSSRPPLQPLAINLSRRDRSCGHLTYHSRPQSSPTSHPSCLLLLRHLTLLYSAWLVVTLIAILLDVFPAVFSFTSPPAHSSRVSPRNNLSIRGSYTTTK